MLEAIHMIQKVSAPVSVMFIFNHRKRTIYPSRVLWDSKVYEVTKIGLHHTYREGRTLYHVFSVETETLSFRLVLDTDTLFWKLEEISDGYTN